MTTDNKACKRNIPRMLINPQTRSTYFTMGEGYRQEKLSGETQMGKLIHEISMEWKKKSLYSLSRGAYKISCNVSSLTGQWAGQERPKRFT